jgi:hypothetical protein
MALEQLEAAWREAAVLHQLRFDWRDRQEPVGLARALALQLHYWPPQELLAGPALLQEYDGEGPAGGACGALLHGAAAAAAVLQELCVFTLHHHGMPICRSWVDMAQWVDIWHSG